MGNITENKLLEIAEVINEQFKKVIIKDILVEIKVSPEELKKIDEHFFIKTSSDGKLNSNFKYADEVTLNINDVKFKIKKSGK